MVTLSCSLNVRFNFLSKDFSYSKGVKGASLRLCVKTETATIASNNPELSFYTVKLFRDHGAERMKYDLALNQLTVPALYLGTIHIGRQ